MTTRTKMGVVGSGKASSQWRKSDRARAEHFRHRLLGECQTLCREVAPELPAIRGDGPRLGEVLRQLLVNALPYMNA